MKYKAKNVIVSASICFSLASCDFNINDKPGPQMSFSIDESRSHGTFLAEYTTTDSLLNGFKINSVFIEKKFWRKDKLLRPKEINCCQSQLVIVCDDGLLDYGTIWVIKDFTGVWSSYSVYKDFEGISLPDSIPIEVLANNSSDSSKVIQRFELHKTPVNVK